MQVFVETGTYRGEMLDAQQNHFRQLFSIELDQSLYEEASKRFEGNQKIKVINGDSAMKLAELPVPKETPVLFWLDAHYSFGDTAGKDVEAPIIKELMVISNRGNGRDVILIDDARLFGWERGYPKKSEIRKLVSRHFPKHRIWIEKDIFFVCPA